jgi:hypothetical protein
MTVLLVSFLCELCVCASSFFFALFSLSVHSVLIPSFSSDFQLLTFNPLLHRSASLP